MYECDMQNAFDFVSHLAIKALYVLPEKKKLWERDFSAFRYNGDKLHFFLITGRGVIFFSMQFLLQFMLGDCIFLRCAELFIYFRVDRQHEKKASLYAKLSFSCFMNILTNIHFACVHQHCQLPIFPSFFLCWMSTTCIFALSPLFVCISWLQYMHFSTSSHTQNFPDLSLSIFCSLPPLLEPTREQRLFRWWLYGFWFGQLCVILIFYAANASNPCSQLF